MTYERFKNQEKDYWRCLWKAPNTHIWFFFRDLIGKITPFLSDPGHGLCSLERVTMINFYDLLKQYIFFLLTCLCVRCVCCMKCPQILREKTSSEKIMMVVPAKGECKTPSDFWWKTYIFCQKSKGILHSLFAGTSIRIWGYYLQILMEVSSKSECKTPSYLWWKIKVFPLWKMTLKLGSKGIYQRGKTYIFHQKSKGVLHSLFAGTSIRICRY